MSSGARSSSAASHFFGLNDIRACRPPIRPPSRRSPPDRHPDDPGRAARDLARRRRDDPEPRPVGHRQDAQRRDAERRRARLTGVGSTGVAASRETPVRDSSSAWTTASIRPADPLIDPGAYSEIRILGIPGNQTTGQQRVPVILTSLRDDTVGTTVRGVQMYDILNSDPVYQPVVNTNHRHQLADDPRRGRRRIHLHRRQLDDRVRPDRSLRRQHHRATPTSAT